MRIVSLLLFTLAAGLPVSTVFAARPLDPGLAIAVQKIWQHERPETTLLEANFALREGSEPPTYQTPHRGGLRYLLDGGEAATLKYRRRSAAASESPWGSLPRVDIDQARIYRMAFDNQRYFVVSAAGTGLFTVGNWRDYQFLFVVDTGARRGVWMFPVVAPAGLGLRVLGRLPDSSVLNFARLVPSRWDAQKRATAYEVLLYAMTHDGFERVADEDGTLLAYLLQSDPKAGRWTLEPTASTPVADVRDAAGSPFTAPHRQPSAAATVTPAAAAAQVPDAQAQAKQGAQP